MTGRPRRRFLRRLSGVLAGGTVALAGLLVVLALTAENGSVRPRTELVVGHVVAAVLVVLAQRWVDRHDGPLGSAAAAGLSAAMVAGLVVNWLM